MDPLLGLRVAEVGVARKADGATVSQPDTTFMPGQEPVVAPGVRAVVFDTPTGIYIPVITAERPGNGEVARYLDALPTDRRIVFPTVISAQLRAMLERRGFRPNVEWAPEFQEHVDIYERLGSGQP